MSKSEIIVAALKLLDPTNDEQWNADGSAKVDVVNTLTEGDEKYAKADIDESWPGFNRTVAADEVDEEGQEDEEDNNADPNEFETGADPVEAIQPELPVEVSDEDLEYMGAVLDDDEEDCDCTAVEEIASSLNKAKNAAGRFLSGKLIDRLDRAAVRAQEAADEAAGVLKSAQLAVANARNKLHIDGTPSLAECNAGMKKRLVAEKKALGGQFPLDKGLAPRRARGRPDYNPSEKNKKQMQ